MKKRERKPKGTLCSAWAAPGIDQTLQHIAEQKMMSVAWDIRDAAERYFSEHWPLIAANQGGTSDTQRTQF